MIERLKNIGKLSIIEVMGIPRSGKTTYIQKHISGYAVINEFFDRCPVSRSRTHDYNVWYAKEIARLTRAASAHTCFDRGPHDRYCWAQALYQHDVISVDERDEEQEVIFDAMDCISSLILCDCSIATSLKRDSYSDSLTSDAEFLSILQEVYRMHSQDWGGTVVRSD